MNQGRDSAAILTNRSDYVTVVTLEPYNQRKVHRNGVMFSNARLSDANNAEKRRNYRRTRPIHQTTLAFENYPVKNNYCSTMRKSFSGQDDSDITQLPRCPSQHTSHFKIGLNNKRYHNTTFHEKFKNYNTWTSSHEDKARWTRHMTGNNMIESMRFSNETEFVTTYSLNNRRIIPIQKSINENQVMPMASFNLISGNKVLHNTRKLNTNFVY